MNQFIITLFFTVIFLFSGVNVFSAEDIKDSIVKIYTQSIKPFYNDPWTMNSPESKSGSGAIIDGNRILTNAHVVSDHTLILVRKYGEARRYRAKLEFISNEADIAVLKIEDESFFENTVPLLIGDLPNTQEEVVVYGFPRGGDTLSTTKGVISRIEHERYAQSTLSFLASQIDAPINPGNSGGPAIIDGKIVGIVMQSLASSENIGYMVPTPVIKHFLVDISDGKYDGFPGLGIVTQNIENSAQKKKYGIKDDNGILIISVIPGSPADGIIEERDVLLSVNGRTISENGTVEFRKKQRTHFSYFIQSIQIGEKLDMEIIRNGKIKDLSIKLDKPIQYNQLIPTRHDSVPSYYIYGGLVFSPLTLNYLREWGNKWYQTAPHNLITRLNSNYKTKPDEQVVVLIRVLASEINQGYHDYENWEINKVNGKEINNLGDLIKIVEDPRDTSRFVTFENIDGKEIVLSKEEARTNNSSILQTYRINSDRSEDFQESANKQ